MTEPIATGTPSPQLDYGLAAPRRAKRVRRLLLLFLASAVGYACWQQGPHIMKQAPILFWQRQCLRYTAPAEQVVYEEDPVEVRGCSRIDRTTSAMRSIADWRRTRRR
jgi:hypothetical protein